MSAKVTIEQIQKKKKASQKITMLTACDYPFARLLDQAGIDIILVGDSLANVALGLESTKEVGLEEMLHHAKAVRRGVTRSLLVGDMPYEAYQENRGATAANARRFIDEAGCDAVKIEWFDQCLGAAADIIGVGIPVMGHVGLTPQTADKLGGFKVQGKEADSARRLIQQTKDLEKAGCFAIVLECVPDKIAKIITDEISVPTIGIGAGAFCDGQVLVTHDLAGLFDKYQPKFVKQYISMNDLLLKAFSDFKKEVENGKFPSKEHSFSIKQEELDKL